MLKNFQLLRDTSIFIIKQIRKLKNRSIYVVGASCLCNLLVGTAKLIMGILSLSFFTCVSAFYTFGMVIAKLCVLKGLIVETDLRKQYHYYKLSGIILIIVSVIYMIYSTRLLWYPVTTYYHKYFGLTIAAFTFIEIGMNIRGVIIERHNHTLLFHAIKMINLASSLICLVLTQTAILSFTHEDIPNYNPSISNSFMGILMGAVATLIGYIMLYRIRKIKCKEMEDKKL